MSDTIVVIDEVDAAQLLRTLYHGRKTEVHVLVCLCGRSADLNKNQKAWNGWQVIPFAKCPHCLQTPAGQSMDAVDCVASARERFNILVSKMTGEC